MKRFIGLGWVCLFFIHSYGQISNTTYRAETFGSVATGVHTPFWMNTHRWGVTTLDANNFYVRGGLFHEQTIDRNWSFETGMDVIGGNHSPYGNVWVQQLYGRLNWKKLRLDIGLREDYLSLLNPRLSSGDYVHSNHSRPLPQIRGSLPDFLLIPLTKGNLYVKVDFAVGAHLDGKWIENRARPTSHEYAKNVLSHDKSLYLRWGNIDTKTRQQLTFGLLHRALWGGTLTVEDWDNPGTFTVFNQKITLDSFLRVVLARRGGANSSPGDQSYVAGHHWGIYLLKYDYKLKNDQRISAYIQHMFEDKSGMINFDFFDDNSGIVLQNYPDNLYGLEWRSSKKTIISGIVFEYIYTKQQSGTMHFHGYLSDDHDIPNGIKNGNDDYYDNVEYISGPSHFGKTQGTPFFLSPEYNTDGSVNFKGNRIKAFHLGLEGYFNPSLQYRLLLSTGQNWGRFYQPFTYVHKGFASKFELTYTLPKPVCMDVRFETGYDTGDFFGGKTFGAGVTLSKQGVIFKGTSNN